MLVLDDPEADFLSDRDHKLVEARSLGRSLCGVDIAPRIYHSCLILYEYESHAVGGILLVVLPLEVRSLCALGEGHRPCAVTVYLVFCFDAAALAVRDFFFYAV